MKRRESEYIIDRLQAEIQHYKDIADTYEREYKTLQSECKFGAFVGFLFGVGVGIALGAFVVWL